VPKSFATWADPRGNASARACARWPLGRPAPGSACDDLRLADLKLIFLIVTRAVSLPRLSRREVWWKDAEILILRHQPAVTLREQPRAHWCTILVSVIFDGSPMHPWCRWVIALLA
jgi:hypothetical protein